MPRIHRKPRLLDLFCGIGGCSMGYSLAGFDVTGVDLMDQPAYPFKFIKADSLTVSLDGFDCYHASPPCQRYSVASSMHGSRLDHPDLVGPVRDILRATGKPYAIENVVGAPLLKPVQLCGTRFVGLRVIRHRLFECNFWVRKLSCGVHHPVFDASKPRSAINNDDEMFVSVFGGGNCTVVNASLAMGIDWHRNKYGLNQAIPPSYTRYIGKFMLDAVRGVRDFSRWYPDFIT